MKEELAALKKKFDAGKLTKFKYNQGVKDIRKNYGKATPSNVGRIINFISAKVGPAMTEISPQSAKAVAARKTAAAKKKAAEQTASSDRQLIKRAGTTPKKDNFLAGLDLTKKKKRAAPKFNPSGLKVPAKKKAAAKKTAAKKEKLYDTINPKTGKLTNKKVSAKQHLKNIDMNKARIKKEAQEKLDRNLKIAVKKSMNKKKRG